MAKWDTCEKRKPSGDGVVVEGDVDAAGRAAAGDDDIVAARRQYQRVEREVALQLDRVLLAAAVAEVSIYARHLLPPSRHLHSHGRWRLPQTGLMGYLIQSSPSGALNSDSVVVLRRGLASWSCAMLPWMTSAAMPRADTVFSGQPMVDDPNASRRCRLTSETSHAGRCAGRSRQGGEWSAAAATHAAWFLHGIRGTGRDAAGASGPDRACRLPAASAAGYTHLVSSPILYRGLGGKREIPTRAGR